MKIIQILPALKEGGVETGTMDLSLSLQSRGHDVTVISNSDIRSDGVQILNQNGIRHLEWPVDKKKPITIYKMSRKLRHYILKNSPDIIHARSRVPAWITWLATRKTKTKWVTTCHGYYQTHIGSRVMGWADAVIVPSKTIEKHMKENFHVPEDKMTLIWRGVDLEKYRFDPPVKPGDDTTSKEKPVIAMIGRLSPIKGHKDFLKALLLLKRKNIPFSAWIIGDQTTNPPYTAELLHIKDALDLKEEVHFLGHQPNVSSLLKKIDLVIFPSTHPESFGRTIIEAQASGIAVAASRIGGPQEIIEEEVTGLLFQPNSPSEIADAIEKILADPEKTLRMTYQARLKVEKEFSKIGMVEKTEALYRKLIEGWIPAGACPRPRSRAGMTFKKILLIKIGSLGDLILISPSLRAIRKQFPATQLTLLTDRSSQEISAHCPYLDDILYLQKERYWSDIFKIRQRLVSRQFDISIDFQNNRWTHAVGFLSQIPRRYGYARKWGRFCLTHTIRDQVLPPVKHQFQILKQLGIHPTDDHLEFWITEEDQRSVEKLLEKLGIKKPLVGIHIGSNWPTKRWRGKHIAEFAQMIQKDEGTEVVLMGSSKELEFEKEIMALAQNRNQMSRLFSAIGKTTLRELGALIQRCSFFVSSDSAPLHIAAAVGTPTIALFGPTDPFRHLPPGKKIVPLSQKVDCGPCYRSTCRHHFLCMEKIEPTAVIELAKGFLRQTRRWDDKSVGRYFPERASATLPARKGNISPHTLAKEQRSMAQKDRAKVLHLTTHLNIGGITTHLLQLCRGLKKSGIEPQIASSGGEMTDAFEEYQIKTHLIPLRTKHELSLKIIRSYFALKKLYTQERWDFIHAHTRVSQWLAALLSHSLNIPYFTSFHGFYQYHLGRRFFPCLGSHVLAISNAVEQDLKNRYPAISNRISTVHFGLDLARFQPNAIPEMKRASFKKKIGLKELPTLGIIARLSPEKGHLELLDIVSDLHKKRPVQLLIVGDGKQKKEIVQKIQALHLEDVVFLLPPQKDPRLPLSVIDIYASFCVKREGFGISLLEAMAMRKPVVVFDKGGGVIDFVENGRNGFILAQSSKEQMAEKIEDLIEHPDWRNQIAEAALQTVKERFSYEKMGEKVWAIYKTVMSC